MRDGEVNRLVLKSFLEQQVAMLTALGPVAYMITLIMGLPPALAWHTTLIDFVTLVPVFGVILPLVALRRVLTDALTDRPGDIPGDKLRRILKAPRRLEAIFELGYLVSCTLWAGWPTVVYGLDPWNIPLTVASFCLLAAVVGIRLVLRLERMLRPYALEEFHKHPQLRLEDSGYTWPKQSWYLPYCFALVVLATLTVAGTIVYKKTQTGFGGLFERVAALVPAPVLAQLRTDVASILGTIVLPVVCIGGFMILAAAWCAWEIARHQTQGTDAVRKSIESIASGKPALPDWVATDEVGDLSFSTAAAFERLRTFSSSLADSARMLGESAEELGGSTLQADRGTLRSRPPRSRRRRSPPRRSSRRPCWPRRRRRSVLQHGRARRRDQPRRARTPSSRASAGLQTSGAGRRHGRAHHARSTSAPSRSAASPRR